MPFYRMTVGRRALIVDWAQVVTARAGHKQTAYRVLSEEDHILYTIGFDDTPPLHKMEWWIVGQKQVEGLPEEGEERNQVELDVGGATQDPGPTTCLSSSSEGDFHIFDDGDRCAS